MPDVIRCSPSSATSRRRDGCAAPASDVELAGTRSPMTTGAKSGLPTWQPEAGAGAARTDGQVEPCSPKRRVERLVPAVKIEKPRDVGGGFLVRCGLWSSFA